MKRIRLGIILGCLAVTLSAGVAFAQTFPEPTGRFVSDFAGLLSPTVEGELENKLARLERDTSDEVAVVTITTLGDSDINSYTADLFEKWGVGKKDKDNGVLFVVAELERKVRIEVGYGLEPVLTDGRCGRILDNEVIPRFKEGDYDTGIMNGVKAIEDYLRAGVPPSLLDDNPLRNAVSGADFLPPLIIGLGIITVYLAGFMARSKDIFLGGIWGAVTGALLGLVAGGILRLVVFSVGLTAFGFFLDWLLSRNYKSYKAHGYSTGWGSTWGGFRGSSGGFGGGVGGGGISFGGGHSGGGGAGRGW